MNSHTSTDLHNFHLFLGEKVKVGEAISPEDALDEWRSLHPSAAEIEEDIAAVGEALEAIEQGDQGVDFDEFSREIRGRYGLNS